MTSTKPDQAPGIETPRMVTQEQEGDLELKPSILDIDCTPSHIATLLAAEPSDQEQCALAEKINIELINKNNEREDLLENNEKLLKEQTDLETKQRGMLEKHSMICSPDEYFSMAFQNKISKNRESRSTKWIFDLIKGRIKESETVYINRKKWMLVLGDKTTKKNIHYLVIFKDTSLHSIRNVHSRHVSLLEGVEATVRSFLCCKHGNHKQFRFFFHYMPSVFQLHMHVCTLPTRDAGRVHPVHIVRRNLTLDAKWYRDGLLLYTASERFKG